MAEATSAEHAGRGAIAAAVTDWSLRLDPSRVLSGEQVGSYARTTLPSAPRPAAVVRLSTRDEVVTVLEVASRHRVPVYPISRGKNWGWGDACPPTDGQVVVDLSGLDAIDVDEDLGVATVEPGVTQQQLAQRLLGTAWVADATAAGPHASVLGSIIERGTGKTALGERWASILGLEAVLADGTVVRTGFWDHGDVSVARALRWGLGPALDGLFAQSSFGIVTRVVVTLMPRSAAATLCLAVPDAHLPDAMDRLRRLRLDGAPAGAPHGFPIARPGSPLRWLLIGPVTGSARVVAAARRDFEERLSDLGPVAVYAPELPGQAGGCDWLLERLALPDEPIFREFLHAGAAFARGWPMDFSPDFVLRYVGGAATQGRTAAPPTADPLDEGYGFWFAWPAGSTRARDVRRLVDLVLGTLARHGRPPTLTLASPNARTLVGVTRVCFDRRDPADTAIGERCYADLLAAARAAGFPPARAGIGDMAGLDPDGSAHWSIVRRLKHALDPDGIIAPGRYVPLRRTSQPALRAEQGAAMTTTGTTSIPHDVAWDVRGQVLWPGDPGYDEARGVYNAMIDKHPGVIVRPAGAADIIEAVNVARERGLPLAVRCGGHSIAGNGVCDDGVLVDLSSLKGVRVDPVARVARANAGVLWGEFDRETQLFGLATPGGRTTTTGVGGFTLGGGYGWLSSKYGLACDNLLSVDLVTADGRIVTASERENEELFWGLRGGGGNFGVVTSYEFALHPVGPIVLGGLLIYPFEAARDVMVAYREYIEAAPEELVSALAVLQGPPEPFLPPEHHGHNVLGLVTMWVGDPHEGERHVAPLRRLGPVLTDLVQPMPYTAFQAILDGFNPWGYQNYHRGLHLRGLSDDAIAGYLQGSGEVPSSKCMTILFRHGGAVARVPADATAAGHRDTPYLAHPIACWPDKDDTERHLAWIRAFTREMEPHTTGGVYLNFEPAEAQGRVRAGFEEGVYARLVALKDAWDPENVFRVNQNILPSARRRAADADADAAAATPQDAAALPPSAQVMQLSLGVWMTQVVYVVAKLAICDLLADGPRTVEDLASAVGADADRLARVLRAAEALDLLASPSPGKYALGPLGGPLRTGVPDSVRYFAILNGEEHYRYWGHLLDAVRSDDVIFDRVFGEDAWRYNASHAEAGETFNRAMGDLARNVHVPAILGFDFAGYRSVIDIGGGTGSMLAAVLTANPHLSGVLFDLDEVVAQAPAVFEAAGVIDRVVRVPGDYLQAVPAGIDVYTVSLIFQDLDDDKALPLLHNVRRAMRPDSVFVAVELVIPDDPGFHLAKLNDLNVLMLLGGRVRTAEEFRALFARAGLTLREIRPSPGPMSLVIGVPAS